MTENKDKSIQMRFLQYVKEMLHPNISFVDELSLVLDISNDSAYRRIRGETALTIQDVARMCEHYKVSFDLFTQDAPQATFYYNEFSDTQSLGKYIVDLRGDMERLYKSPNKQLTYVATDIPIFHYFKFPMLAAFKSYYWLKMIINDPEYKDRKFEDFILNDEVAATGREIFDMYLETPSVEIWTTETLNSLLKQIEYTWLAGNFKNKSDALDILKFLEEEVNLIAKQAAKGYKDLSETPSEDSKLTFYASDLEFGNNYILAQKGNITTSYITFHSFNRMVTTNEKFAGLTNKWVDNLIRKATLVSGVAEAQRFRFFNEILRKVNSLKKRIDAEEF